MKSTLIALSLGFTFFALFLAFSIRKQIQTYFLYDYEVPKHCDTGENYADRTDGDANNDDAYRDWNRSWSYEMAEGPHHEAFQKLQKEIDDEKADCLIQTK